MILITWADGTTSTTLNDITWAKDAYPGAVSYQAARTVRHLSLIPRDHARRMCGNCYGTDCSR